MIIERIWKACEGGSQGLWGKRFVELLVIKDGRIYGIMNEKAGKQETWLIFSRYHFYDFYDNNC